MGYIDLHLHSNNSDGVLSPQDLINELRKAGITTAAITDHNKLLPDYEELQKKNPDVRLIRGSEISSLHVFSSGKKVEVHIVGLILNETPELLELLKKNTMDNGERIKEILSKLKEYDINIGSYEDLQTMFPGKRIGRMQVAKALVAYGVVKSVSDAFDTYIGDYGKRLAYVENPIQFAPIKEVVHVIKKAHGIAVLAHSRSYKLDDAEFQELLEVFKAAGGDAMEVEYGKYNTEDRKFLAETATKWELIPSCGSDFHGNSIEERLDYHFRESDYYQLCQKI